MYNKNFSMGDMELFGGTTTNETAKHQDVLYYTTVASPHEPHVLESYGMFVHLIGAIKTIGLSPYNMEPLDTFGAGRAMCILKGISEQDMDAIYHELWVEDNVVHHQLVSLADAHGDDNVLVSLDGEKVYNNVNASVKTAHIDMQSFVCVELNDLGMIIMQSERMYRLYDASANDITTIIKQGIAIMQLYKNDLAEILREHSVYMVRYAKTHSTDVKEVQMNVADITLSFWELCSMPTAIFTMDGYLIWRSMLANGLVDKRGHGIPSNAMDMGKWAKGQKCADDDVLEDVLE